MCLVRVLIVTCEIPLRWRLVTMCEFMVPLFISMCTFFHYGIRTCAVVRVFKLPQIISLHGRVVWDPSLKSLNILCKFYEYLY